MVDLRLLALPGDGIGPEVTAQALSVFRAVAEAGGLRVTVEEGLFGGVSIDATGAPVTDALLERARGFDAVFLGAVGGPEWDDVATESRPERGLLRLRRALGVYANIRPARFFEGLIEASPLRAERCSGADFVVVRELIGGIYFGEPRGLSGQGAARRGFNTMAYSEAEIARVGRHAFELARARKGRLVSVDKANVLEVSQLWREVMGGLSAEYPDVSLSHMYVDNCAMQLVRDPSQFDVIVTGNLFGDILSDIAGALTGSLGMLPSAAVGEGPGLYEPVHGSAPDIAGKGVANPLGAILSVAMLLGLTAGRPDLQRAVEGAVEAILSEGYRTGDLRGRAAGEGARETVGTEAMGAAVTARALRSLDLPAAAGERS